LEPNNINFTISKLRKLTCHSSTINFMSRIFINDLADGTKFDEIYLASQKQLRPNRQGNLYLQLRISDKTGALTAMMWNANQDDYDRIANGDYVRVQGNSQVYNGAVQVIVKSVAKIDKESVDDADFTTMDMRQIEKLAERLTNMLRQMQNTHLVHLAEAYLIDDAFMTKMKSAPAGIKNHHAYTGGLLQHVVDLMELAAFVGNKYENLDADLLLMAAFLHDSGKVDELTYNPDFGYSDAGQLIGHMVLGVEMMTLKISEAEKLSGEPFPQELSVKLKHLIMSHHGEPAHGSPIVPMMLEGIALNLLDNLDAKLQSVTQLIAEDMNSDSHWTIYNPALGRKIFKPSAKIID